jgi:hypothetical protein
MGRHLALLWWALLPACTGGTGGDAVDASADTVDESTVGCMNDQRVLSYQAGLQVAGQSGMLKAALLSSDPGPPLRGSNTWTVKIMDGSGAPVPNPTIKVTPFMPDHGHGTSIIATATPQPDGTVTITPLYLFMPGVWRVTLDITSSAGNDSIVFYFCIAG